MRDPLLFFWTFFDLCSDGFGCFSFQYLLIVVGLRKSPGFSSTWSTLRKKFRLENGKKSRSTYQAILKLMIIDTPWRYFSKSGNKSILKRLIGINYCLFVWVLVILFIHVMKHHISCQSVFSNFRQDKAKGVEILVNDLKVFSSFNEDLFKEITQLLTLNNFR